MELSLLGFRVQNFKNIEDSGWVPLDRVTALVGRNESGKTTLLKALHKFNPATEEPYNPQKEFPRHRFTSDFKDGDGSSWPVASIEFEIGSKLRAAIAGEIGKGAIAPKKITVTRFYDGSYSHEFDADLVDDDIAGADIAKSFGRLSSEAKRFRGENNENEEGVQQTRTQVSNWADEKRKEASKHQSLRTEEGLNLLKVWSQEANGLANPISAASIENLQAELSDAADRVEEGPVGERVFSLVYEEMPVFVYFENYGILDSAVYLPRFLGELGRSPSDPRIRTIAAMFKHVNLSPAELSDLGVERAATAKAQGQEVTHDMIVADQEKKELRAVKLNSASLDITERFSTWYGQRRHNISYDADGDYFRIWVSDDRRPGVNIELENRSKGFQWFFSFYLVFLVEADEGHKNAVLLLDEPGIHLHPTAQQELISFFERLSENNPLVYSTHSPFLIDGEHIQRVRPVSEGDDGIARVSVDGWPADRETIFPLQAAAGYAMLRGLFQHHQNVLVEGMSDYLFLHALSLQCAATGKKSLPADVYIIPCGGTKNVGHLASLFLGQEVRPVVLLDGDEAGRVRRDALMRELYAGQEWAVLMLDDLFAQEDFMIEDLVGEVTITGELAGLLGREVELPVAEAFRPVVKRVVEWAETQNVVLPGGWKPEIARRLAVLWSQTPSNEMPTELLDRAATLFGEIENRFERGSKGSVVAGN